MKVVMQGETSLVDSQKSENGKLAKCNIVLQEFGGKFENQFAAVMLGKDAQLRFYAGEVVVVKLRFRPMSIRDRCIRTSWCRTSKK